MSTEKFCQTHGERLVPIDCPKCWGQGYYEDDEDLNQIVDCHRCKGTGETQYLECQECASSL